MVRSASARGLRHIRFIPDIDLERVTREEATDLSRRLTPVAKKLALKANSIESHTLGTTPEEINAYAREFGVRRAAVWQAIAQLTSEKAAVLGDELTELALNVRGRAAAGLLRGASDIELHHLIRNIELPVSSPSTDA